MSFLQLLEIGYCGDYLRRAIRFDHGFGHEQSIAAPWEGFEPAGYIDWLRRQDPMILWDDGGHRPTLQTEADWILDFMRYAAPNQGGDDLANYDGFIPIDFPHFKKLPDPDKLKPRGLNGGPLQR